MIEFYLIFVCVTDFCLCAPSLLPLQVLKDLAVPHYHHELVKDAVELSFDQPGSGGDVIATLLAALSASGVISSTQMAQVSSSSSSTSSTSSSSTRPN